MEQIISFFHSRYSIKDPALANLFQRERYVKKNELLVAPGQQASFLAFIKSGAFRVYFHNTEGYEMTTWFSFANMFVTDLLAYYTDQPAQYFVEAIEPSEIAIVKKSDLERLYDQHPAVERFARKFAENGMVRLMQRMVTLQTKSAKDRYLELMAQPAFIQRIPLKYLATYLGITDTSLSRIRREVATGR